MARRSSARTGSLAAVDPGALATVIGGRFTPRTTLDPVLLEGIQQLSAAITSIGESLAAAKQSSSQQMMQLIQQLMERRQAGPS